MQLILQKNNVLENGLKNLDGDWPSSFKLAFSDTPTGPLALNFILKYFGGRYMAKCANVILTKLRNRLKMVLCIFVHF